MNAPADGSGDGGPEALKQRLMSWLRPVVEEGWLPVEEIASLESVETRGAERLFEAHAGRPLTVGFFGGTGVGKSSLLNRLVGEPVAEVGVERPTSTDVTLYAHERFPVRDLSDELPVDRVRVLTHHRDAYRDVVWVDMPDIDSVDESNRELVLEWLPCIDWLIYVVSPEKYRDDAGWRVLRRRGHRHHWLFVINRWDTGSEAQHADFERLLVDAGVPDPVVLRTSCAGDAGDDDFDEMAATIDRAVAEHGVERLQRIGELARLADLEERCDRYAEMLGDSRRWRRFIEQGRAAMGDKLAGLHRYLREEAAVQAAAMPDHQSDAASTGHEPAVPGLVADHVEDLESAVVIRVEDLPAAPVRAKTKAVLESLRERVIGEFRDGFREGAALPGNALQRALAAAMKKLVYGLPLVAGAGMAYIVASRYRAGLSGEGEFLGFEFLAHSLMVLGLSALLPYLAARLLRPSVRRSIVKRVATGVRALTVEVLGEWTEAMKSLEARAGALVADLDAIRAAVEARSSGK